MNNHLSLIRSWSMDDTLNNTHCHSFFSGWNFHFYRWHESMEWRKGKTGCICKFEIQCLNSFGFATRSPFPQLTRRDPYLDFFSHSHQNFSPFAAVNPMFRLLSKLIWLLAVSCNCVILYLCIIEANVKITIQTHELNPFEGTQYDANLQKPLDKMVHNLQLCPANEPSIWSRFE